MDNTVNVRAHFTGCNIKNSKTVMQFELDPEYKNTLPKLAMMTGGFVNLDITSDQTVLFVDSDSGGIIDDQQEEASYFETESAFPEEDVIDDQQEEAGLFQLPPADYTYGDETDAVA